jgi:hypothetical protein
MRKEYVRVQYNDKGHKQCTKCKGYKETSNFHKYAKAQDGLKPWCKSCVKEYDLKENDATRKMPRKLQGKKIHCRKCERYLDKSSFWGQLTYCKECSKLVGHSSNLKRFGLTVEGYIDLEKSQNGVCKICKLPEENRKRLCVDHDHSCCPGSSSCGKCVRGLICFRCNTALGMVKDNLKILEAMMEYLQK